MSAASLFLSNNYGQYISILEAELAKGGLSPAQQVAYNSNIAAAQLELGLYRKAIKAAQSAIDLFPSAGCRSISAYVIKGKALLAAGKPTDAVQAWKDGISACSSDPLADVVALAELNRLVLGNTAIQTAQSLPPPPAKIQSSSDTPSHMQSVTAPIAPDTATTAPIPKSPDKKFAASAPTTASHGPAQTTPKVAYATPPPAPASSTAQQASPTKTKAVGPATATGSPVKASTAAPAKGTHEPFPAAALTSSTKGSMSNPNPTSTEACKSALQTIHRRSLGDGENMIKPIYLTAIKQNLPHVTGESLVDDMVCLGYVHVNSGDFETASSIFKLINQYRSDVPAAMIGAGSIAAMQHNFDLAIKEFSAALVIDDSIADAWKRRGQTRAAKGQVKTALKDLSRAIALQPNDADMYNQRGLVYHQMKNYTRALGDFRQAQEKGLNTAALWNYIGMCEGQRGNMAPSIKAHEKAVRLQSSFKEAQLNIALMHKEVANVPAALSAFTAAIKLDPQPFFQAYAHRGVMYMQLGKPGLALKDLTVAINALYTIAVGNGNGTSHTPEEKALRKGELVQNLVRAALCYQSVGQYNKTVGYFDQASSLHPSNNCLFLREVALYLWSHLDVDLSLYNADDRVDPRLKDGWCKHADWAEYMGPHLTGAARSSAAMPGAKVTDLANAPFRPATKPTDVPCVVRYASLPADEDGELLPLRVTPPAGGASAGSVAPGMAMEDQKLQLVHLANAFAGLVQLNSPGFLPNRRQHRMFGLSVLQMANTLSQHLALIGQEGVGLAVPDAASSRCATADYSVGRKSGGTGSSSSSTGTGSKAAKESTPHKVKSLEESRSDSPSGKRGAAATTHVFGWRDLYDIAVRWRQVSEPGDPVWWIDRFPTRAFQEGFGLQTPLVNGHLTTVRYAPYYQPAFDRVKDILQHQGYYTVSDVHVSLDGDGKEAVRRATNLSELQAAVGRDFYVVVPCPSVRESSLVLEGTRLTLLTQEPEGFDFTIRTPGKPHRWQQYDDELNTSFHRLEELFLDLHHRHTAGGVTEAGASDAASRAADDNERILRCALELFYLWVTFAPLSRGTAACGYAGFCAVLLALGKRVASPQLLPAGKQLDWEAILAVDFASFYEAVRGWFRLADAGGEILTALHHPWAATDGGADALYRRGKDATDAFACVRTLKDMLDIMCLPYNT